MLALTERGDRVKVTYRESNSPVKELVAFENTGFAQQYYIEDSTAADDTAEERPETAA